MISTSKRIKQRGSQKYQQLETVRKIAVIPSTGIKFINGISNQYSSKFPKELKGIVDPQKYEQYINRLNRKVKQFWPCAFAYYCGYCCTPVTLGMSLFLPKLCIDEAEAVLIKEIDKINIDVLGNSKLEMRLVKKCYDSYLIVQQRDFADFQLNNDFVL